MDRWTNGWIDICTIGWIYGLMDGLIYALLEIYWLMDGVLDGYGLMDVVLVGIWTNGWIYELMDGYVDWWMGMDMNGLKLSLHHILYRDFSSHVRHCHTILV